MKDEKTLFGIKGLSRIVLCLRYRINMRHMKKRLIKTIQLLEDNDRLIRELEDILVQNR